MNFIKKLLTRKTNYPQQMLSDKQKMLIDGLDSILVKKCSADTTDTHMHIRSIKLGIMTQHYSVGYLLGHMQQAVKTQDFAYIPRSVALIVDADGTWCFYYAIRDLYEGNEITNELFIDALARTNNARNR